VESLGERSQCEEGDSRPWGLSDGHGEGRGGGESRSSMWVGIVANRASGTGRTVALVGRLREELGRRGVRSEVAWTPAERSGLCERSRTIPGCRCLIAVGGDGTVSALVNEIPAVPITVLASGTENLFASHFGLGRKPEELAQTVVSGEVVSCDVGCAEGRRFVLMAGFGFDGDVVTRHHRSRLCRRGTIRPTSRLAYVGPILRSSLWYRFPPLTVRAVLAEQDQDDGEGEVIEGTTVFVFNLPRYALGLAFAPDAQQDDGLLDLLVFREPGPFQALFYLWKVFRGKHLGSDGVVHRRVRRVLVTAPEEVPVQLDGDPAGLVLPGPQGSGPDFSENGEGGESWENGWKPERVVRPSWTVEALPAVLAVLVPAARRGGARVPLVSTGVFR
jgi:diacylglycerol kinase (ATP)